jgi:PAS domain S-box-containing protein
MELKLVVNEIADQKAILICDSKSHRILDANRRACDIYGYSISELQEKQLSDLSATSAPDHRQALAPSLLKAIGFNDPDIHESSDGTLLYVNMEECRLQASGKDSLLFILEIISRPMIQQELSTLPAGNLSGILNEEGLAELLSGLDDPDGSLVSLHDFQDEEPRDEKRFIRTVIESLPGAFYMIDENNRFVLWNRNLEELLESTPDQIRDLDPLEMYREEDRELVIQGIEKAFEFGEAEVEVDLYSPSGQKYRYMITGKRVDIRGQTYILGAGIDVTDRKAALEELKLSHSLLTQLFQSSPVGIVLIDQDEIVMDANPSWVDIFGYSREESIGVYIADLITPPSYRHESAEIIRKLKTRKNMILDHESERQHKDGHMVPVLIGAVPVYVDDEFIAYYVIYVDLTEQKQYEEEIKVSLEEKNVLLREVHHRVKNNLAIVSGLLGLRKYSIDNEELKGILSDCEMQIKSMSLVHEKLYDSSALSRVEFQRYVTDLIHSIRAVYDMGGEVEFELDSNEVELNINQAIPVALLLNELISNAYKHAFKQVEDKRIMIRINELPEQSKVEIHLKDNGVGLPQEFNYEEVTSMGFTIVRTLAEQLDADINFYSDNGTHITLLFDKKDIKGSSGNLV